jgi:glycosyltransferase involved in cell wall biosynthesis
MGFQEALMTGMPIVSIGKQLAGFNLEVPDFIETGVDGFVSDNLKQLYDSVKLMLEDHDYASRISVAARKKALELFSKEKIKHEWEQFFKSL